MNYQWHYDNLIKTRSGRIPVKGQYYEKHHIIMRSMGGSNSASNLILLTAREHFIAHWLLWRIHRNRATATAFYCMQKFVSKNQKRYVTNSRVFAEAKTARFTSEYKKILSERLKGNKFNLGRTFVMTEEQKEKLRLASSGKKHSEETKLKMSLSRKGKSIKSKGRPWTEARRNAQHNKNKNV